MTQNSEEIALIQKALRTQASFNFFGNTKEKKETIKEQSKETEKKPSQKK